MTVSPPAAPPEFTWHADAEATGGGLSIGEVSVAPGDEPPVHVHAREDEVFYVLSGTVVFLRGLELIRAGAGDAVVLPRGIQHGFAVRSVTAHLLVMTTPAGLEEAFRGAAEFEDLGVTFTGPPLPALLSDDGTELR